MQVESRVQEAKSRWDVGEIKQDQKKAGSSSEFKRHSSIRRGRMGGNGRGRKDGEKGIAQETSRGLEPTLSLNQLKR